MENAKLIDVLHFRYTSKQLDSSKKIRMKINMQHLRK